MLTRLVVSRGPERPITLPWPGLAETLGGGFWPGLYVVVGNTGSGKTQFALQAALHAAVAGSPVLYLALELDELQMHARLAGLASSQQWSALYFGKNARQLELARAKAEPILRDLPLHREIGPPGEWDYAGLRPAAEAMRRYYPEPAEAPGSRPLLLVLDFLQVVGSAPSAREHLQPSPRTVLRWRVKLGLPLLVLGNGQAFTTTLAVVAWLLGSQFEQLSPRRRDGTMKRRVKMPPRRRSGAPARTDGLSPMGGTSASPPVGS